MADLAVANNTVVSFHYTLTDDDGTTIDSSQGRGPLPYLHGGGNIVPGLERQMLGKKVGDKFKALVPPAEGYGVKEGPGPQAVPRNQFPDEMELHQGMPFMAQDDTGQPFTVWVVDLDDSVVFVDTNHPLADVTLHFDVEIVEIRNATAEEVQHGHPHGPGGHHHH